MCDVVKQSVPVCTDGKVKATVCSKYLSLEVYIIKWYLKRYVSILLAACINSYSLLPISKF